MIWNEGLKEAEGGASMCRMKPHGGLCPGSSELEVQISEKKDPGKEAAESSGGWQREKGAGQQSGAKA